jgi:lipopolysaccharide exporter
MSTVAPPMTDPDAAPLRKRAARAVAWGYGGSLARMLVQIGAQAVLARLLGPQEFGVFAALMLLIGVSVLAADLVSAPVIQMPTLDAAALRFACAVQWLGSGVVALLSLACLPLFQQAFPQAVGLGWSLVLVAVGIFITGWGGVSLSLLRRELRYREIQLAQLAGYVIGYVVVAVPLALAGHHTHHVLVVAWLVQSTVSTALQYAWARHPLAAGFRFDGWRRFLRYGAEVSLGNVANWLSTSVDRLLVARHAAPVDIGYYNTMLNLMSTPVNQLSSSLSTVAFSVSARADAASLRRGTVIYLHASTLLFGVLYGVFASAPDLWVRLIYGPRWLEGAVFLTPFCVAAASFGLSAAANAVLTSGGSAGSSAVSQVATAALVGIVVASLLQLSVVWAAWGVAAVYLGRAALLAWLSLRRVGEGAAALLQAVCVPAALALAQVSVARGVAGLATSEGLGPWVADLLGLAAGLAIVLALLGLLRRALVPAASRAWIADVWKKLNRRRKGPTP